MDCDSINYSGKNGINLHLPLIILNYIYHQFSTGKQCDHTEKYTYQLVIVVLRSIS